MNHYSTGWWLSHPSEKYEFVSWEYEIPNFSWKVNPNSMVPNGPTSPYFMAFDGLPSGKLLHNYGKSPCLMGKSPVIGILLQYLISRLTQHQTPWHPSTPWEAPASWAVSSWEMTRLKARMAVTIQLYLSLWKTKDISYPIGSMYAIYGNIYHQYTPNVSIYTIHGSYGYRLTSQ